MVPSWETFVFVTQYKSSKIRSVYSRLILVGVENKMKAIKTHILTTQIITNSLLVLSVLPLFRQLDFHNGFLSFVWGTVITMGKQRKHSKFLLADMYLTWAGLKIE